MRLNKYMLIYIVFNLLFASAYCAGNNEEKKVLKAFDDYRSAIISRNGENAYSLVDSETKNYYEKIIKWVLNLSENETKKLGLLDKIFVLRTRHQVDPNIIKKMNGKSFFIYGVNKGWVGEGKILNIVIKVVEIKENLAKTRVIFNNKEAPFGFLFRLEEGKWRIDLTSIFAITNMAFSKQLQVQKLTEDEFIFSMLEAISGKKVSSNIWKPIN